MNKRITFVTLSLMGGGAERVVSILCSQLAEEGIEVSLIVYERKEREYALSNKVKLYVLNKPNGNNSLTRTCERILGMRKLIMEINADIVVAFLAKPIEHAYFATRGLNIRFISTVRNNPELYPTNNRLRFLVNCITKHSDAIMLQTEEQRKYFPQQKNKTFIIGNPVKQEMLDCTYIYREHVNTIAAFGRLSKQKNHELLIRAFRAICQNYPEVILNIWGVGEERERLQSIILESNLIDKVFLRGNTADVLKELLNTDIFVLSSDYEGMPNALMEAMAVGVPCISTNCPTGPKDLICNHETGILVNTNNENELSSALKKLIEDYSLRKKIGETAKEYIRDNYATIKIAEKFWREM